MDYLPFELLILIPLAVSAGLDLYLTLLLLGAAPTTPFWDHPLPGALSDLDSPQVLIVVGLFYLLEFAAERFPHTSLIWNVCHAVIRPVAGALLGLLILDGQPMPILVGGTLLAGACASLAHAVRSGGAIVNWLEAGTAPHELSISLLEDVVVLGIVTLSLDEPAWAAAAATALIAAGSLRASSHVRAFAFATRLGLGRLFQTLQTRRWMRADEIPTWVRRSLSGDIMAPGGGLRGSPVGTLGLAGAPRFTTGWIVIRGDGPVFVFGGRGRPREVVLEDLDTVRVQEHDFYRRLDLKSTRRKPYCIFFGLSGPSPESLRAEFLVD